MYKVGDTLALSLLGVGLTASGGLTPHINNSPLSSSIHLLVTPSLVRTLNTHVTHPLYLNCPLVAVPRHQQLAR